MERPTPPLLITSTGLPMMVADLPQLPQFLPRRDKDTSHSTMLNLILLNMIKETMPGLMLKKVILTLLVGISISQLLVLTIWTQLKIH